MSGGRLSAAYVTVTLLTVAASTFVAVANFTRREFVRRQAARLDVPEAWMPVLGTLHAAAAVGLVLGLVGVPWSGTAAAAGLVLYFVGAVLVHLRAREYSIGPAAAFLALAGGTLALGLAADGGTVAPQ